MIQKNLLKQAGLKDLKSVFGFQELGETHASESL